ncbi:MAG: single-stranded DNA-binding protein [Prochloraceae cyanobacterium]|nr:single-stranded DNA-binding protein [Prochloraceae cyanobacterium]
MTPEQFEKLMTAQREQYKLLKQILEVGRSLDKKLEIIVSDREVKDPDYHKSLAEYKSFDWSSINARVVASDTD